MIPLLYSIFHALLWDANAARRQLRGLIGALAASGALYADKVAELGGGPHLVTAVRAVAFLCVVAVAVHGDATTKPEVQP